MSRTKSGTARVELKARDFIKEKGTVSVKELNDHLGIGDYSSKMISMLNRMGYIISSNKTGREVVSYTWVGEKPVIYATAAEARKADGGMKGLTMKEYDARAEEAVKLKEKAASAPKVEKPAKSSVVIRKAAAKRAPVTVKPKDEVEKTFGSSGNVGGGSFAIDSDFDSMDSTYTSINVADFLK